MRISLNWIKRLLGGADLGGVAELQQLLTLRVAEIEAEVERIGPNLDGVVVGRVLTCAQHPNADRLRVTTVDIGRGAPVPVVCGAANVAVGQLVAVATVGASLAMSGPDGQTKTLTIKAAKLRGEPSEGMICAEDELGLGTSHDGILVLGGDHRPGTPLAAALGIGDTVFVIDNHGLSHRPDLWGHWGWAREVAAVLGLPAPAEPALTWHAAGGDWSVDLKDDGCTTYAGAVIEGVTNTQSPRWMQDLLNAVGVRPHGLLIDVTNFVMLELGEPMHAFDRRDLVGERIVVRSAAAGEKFRTLDGKDHTLAIGDLLIADGARALALAGIMGGENSMVKADTSAVLLEAAIFRSERIRRTRVRTGVSSDSATRFEKGLYPEMAAAAINRAVGLLKELCPGCRLTHSFCAGPLTAPARTVDFDWGHVERLVGLKATAGEQTADLGRLGFAVAGSTVPGSTIAVPWWRRKDIHLAVDLVEEIARIRGLGSIQPQVPRLPAAAPAQNLLRSAEHRARRLLSAHGWDEVATYAFTSDAWVDLLGWDPAQLIRLANPLSALETVLRPNLIPTMADAMGRNRKHSQAVAIYEIGKCYVNGIGNGPAPDESLVVAGMYAGAGDKAPFYAARDAALALLSGLGYQASIAPDPRPNSALNPSRTVRLQVEGNAHVGFCGELTAAVRQKADCPERVGFFQITLEYMLANVPTPKPKTFISPSRFPVVDRDFNWVCPEALPFGELAAATRRAAGELCTDLELVSIYRGDQLPSGHKAVCLRLFLQAGDRTLDERELNGISAKVISSIESRKLAQLRA